MLQIIIILIGIYRVLSETPSTLQLNGINKKTKYCKGIKKIEEK